MNKLIISEFQEQCLVVEYLEMLLSHGKVKVFSAVPNNTFTKSWVQKRKQVAEGVRPGVPDMIIVTENHCLFLEMKKQKGGTLSAYQKEWIQALQGKKVVATVAKGFDQARVVIDSLL